MKTKLLFLLLLIFNFTGFSQDIQTGLITRISFCGNLNDQSGNNNNGQYMGGVSPTYATDYYGNENSAMYFNGIFDWVNITASESINSPLAEATVAVWVNYQSVAFGQWAPICAKTNTTSVVDRQYSLGINHTTGQIYWHSTYVATAALELNTWYHIAVTYTPEVLKCYLNGIYIGEATPVDPISQNDKAFEIGRDTPVSTDYFNGVMDEMNVYNRALSAADVMALMLYDGCNPTSIESNDWKSQIEIYPNPVTSILKVNFENSGKLHQIKLLNIFGQTVFETESDLKHIAIEMSDFANGIYFIQIEGAEGTFSQKIVK